MHAPARLHLARARAPVSGDADRGRARRARTRRPPLRARRTSSRTSNPWGSRARRSTPRSKRSRSSIGRSARCAEPALSALRTFAQRSLHEAPDLARAIERHDPDVLADRHQLLGRRNRRRGLGAAVGDVRALPAAAALPRRSAVRAGPAPHGRSRSARSATRSSLAWWTLSWDRTAMPTINRLRAEHGLPAVERFDDLLARPPLLLSLTAEGFEYPRSDWPANVRLVGPVNWSPPQPPPAWLEDLSDPLVLVTCSTERQRDKRLLHVALEALPASRHVGDRHHRRARSRRVPRAAREQGRALRRARGRSSSARPAWSATAAWASPRRRSRPAFPVVVVPFGRDQLETARRVEFAGAGVRFSPSPPHPANASRRPSARRSECGEGARAREPRLRRGGRRRGRRETRSRRSSILDTRSPILDTHTPAREDARSMSRDAKGPPARR